MFQHVNIKQYKNPQADFEPLLVGDIVPEAVRIYYVRLKDAVAANYGNAIIPTLFKNQTKCKDLFQTCLKEADNGQAAAVPVEVPADPDTPPLQI